MHYDKEKHVNYTCKMTEEEAQVIAGTLASMLEHWEKMSNDRVYELYVTNPATAKKSKRVRIDRDHLKSLSEIFAYMIEGQ